MGKYFLVLTLYLSSFLLWSQDNPESLRVRSFLTEDGLSQSSIQGITQDVFGFMWISTGDGLNCFDGNTFTRYYFHSFSQGSDQSNSMRNVISDSIGNLWIGTDRGLLFLDRSKDVLVQAFPDIPELINHACLPLFCNDDSVSVLVGSMGILSIHKARHRFSRIPLNKGLEGLALLGETEDEKWFGFNFSTVISFKNKPKSGIELKEYRLDNQITELNVAVAKLSENRYLMATTNNLYLLSEVSGKVDKINHRSWKFFPENSRIVAMLKDKQNRIWLATSNHGIIILNKDFTLNKHIQNLITIGKDQLDFRNILSLYNDRAGNIWIGTDGSGLGLYYSIRPRFGLVDQIVLNQESIAKPFIRCFLQDENNQLWIGTYSTGLICWNRETKQFNQKKLNAASGFPSANDIYCLTPFFNNQMLVGTSCGLWVVNLTDNKTLPLEGHIQGSSIQKATDIIPLEGNNFEILLNNNTYEISIQKNKISFSPSVFPDTVSYDKIVGWKGNSILAFSGTGFYRAYKGKLTHQYFVYDHQKVKLKVNAAHITPEGLLWLATNHGLVYMEASGNILYYYNETNGFPNHYIYGILAANDHTLWVSSNRGLTEFDMETRQIINYGMEDGLQSLEFNSGAFYKNTLGEMFFGGIGGFNYFYPDSIHYQTINPEIYIRKVFVNDQLFQTDSCWMAKKSFYLTYSQNTVTFELTGLDYTKRGSILYSYILEGHDRNWISTINLIRIRYSKLAPGNYSLKVFANTQGKFSENKPLALHFTIQKPFWMKTSFQIISYIIILTIIVLAARYFSILNIKKRIAKLEHQREISLIRRRIASDLHDDVGSGLSKLAMMSDKARINAKDEFDFNNYLAIISGEARRMIDQLRVIVWTLNPQEDKLDGLIAYIHRHISDYLEEFPLTYKIEIPKEIPELMVTPEFKRNVYYTIREAAHNAVKHAEADRIQVLIEIDKKQLKVRVEDNGKGIDLPLENSTGNGILFMEKRIADLAGNVTISGKAGLGTIVEFSVPL